MPIEWWKSHLDFRPSSLSSSNLRCSFYIFIVFILRAYFRDLLNSFNCQKTQTLITFKTKNKQLSLPRGNELLLDGRRRRRIATTYRSEDPSPCKVPRKILKAMFLNHVICFYKQIRLLTVTMACVTLRIMKFRSARWENTWSRPMETVIAR